MAVVKTLIGNIKGPKGDTGAKGDTGEKGDIGATGQRGSRWTQGTAITGTSTTDTVFSDSGISDALVNDNYLNTSTGNTYRCTVGGDASTAMWVYSGNIKGVKGDTGAKGDKGDTGATGPQGEKGEKGDNGVNSFSDHDTATSGTSFTDAEDGNMLVTDWTKNLFNPTLDTTTKNGVTCTNNGDGTYTLDGTASITTYFIISGVIYDKNIINKYEGLKLAGAPSGSSYESFCLYAQFNGGQSTQKTYDDFGNGIKLNNIKGYETLEIIICVRSGKTVSNLTFKPMLTTDLSATYDDFVPYGGYNIQSCGKNFLNPTLETTTNNGITCTANGDGTYTLNGTNTNTITYFNMIGDRTPSPFKIYETVRFLGIDSNSSDVKISFSFSSGDGQISTIVERKISSGYVDINVPKNTKCMFSYIQVESGAVLNNVIIKPMITTDLNATYDDYEPYTGETITVTNETESPAFGLKSHKGITNIISPGNVKCVYPTNESGVSVLEKERQLDENKSDVVIDKSTGNKVVFTIENGIICAREA